AAAGTVLGRCAGAARRGRSPRRTVLDVVPDARRPGDGHPDRRALEELLHPGRRARTPDREMAVMLHAGLHPSGRDLGDRPHHPLRPRCRGREPPAGQSDQRRTRTAGGQLCPESGSADLAGSVAAVETVETAETAETAGSVLRFTSESSVEATGSEDQETRRSRRSRRVQESIWDVCWDPDEPPPF